MSTGKAKPRTKKTPGIPAADASERVILYAYLEGDVDLSDRLQEGMFRFKENGALFGIIYELRASGRVADGVAVAQHITENELEESVGGLARVGELTDYKSGVAQVEGHIREMVNAWMRREGLRVTGQYQEGVTKGDADPLSEFASLTNLLSVIKAAGDRAMGVKDSDGYSLQWVDADKVTPRAIDWLMYPYLPTGYLVGIVGDEGLGKTYITCALGAGVTTGTFFTGETCEPGKVMMLSTEDDYESVTVPRLIRLGADISRVKILTQPLLFTDAGLTQLESDIIIFQPKLVIVDPVFAYTEGDTNQSPDSRRVLGRLLDIARREGCVFMLVRHTNKSRGGGDPRAAGLGSVEWRTVVRCEILVGSEPGNINNRSFAHSKCNLAPLAEPLGYEIKGAVDDLGNVIRGDIGWLRWTGKSDLTAEKIVAQAQTPETREAISDAEKFLKAELAEGERLSKEVYAAGSQTGYDKKAIFNAAKQLGVESRKLSFKEGWAMRLPGDPPTLGGNTPPSKLESSESSESSSKSKESSRNLRESSQNIEVSPRPSTREKDSNPLMGSHIDKQEPPVFPEDSRRFHEDSQKYAKNPEDSEDSQFEGGGILRVGVQPLTVDDLMALKDSGVKIREE